MIKTINSSGMARYDINLSAIKPQGCVTPSLDHVSDGPVACNPELYGFAKLGFPDCPAWDTPLILHLWAPRRHSSEPAGFGN